MKYGQVNLENCDLSACQAKLQKSGKRKINKELQNKRCDKWSSCPIKPYTCLHNLHILIGLNKIYQTAVFALYVSLLQIMHELCMRQEHDFE